MNAQSNLAPVIIKRKKVSGGDGHHGGAWKVAYADFVTAMMAFFLLMWLLNATTEKQRKGIADFFTPTISVNRISGGGDGSFGGDSVFTEETLARNGSGASNKHPTESNQARGEMSLWSEHETTELAGESDDALKKLENELLGRGGESMVSPEAQRHILTRVTDEGLVVELFDLEHGRLFETESDNPTPLLEELAALLVDVGQLVQNNIAIEGHTRSEPIVRASNPVWGLSTARADRMRLLLQSIGLETSRIRRVTGNADREPVVANPMAIRNNRIEVIFLRS